MAINETVIVAELEPRSGRIQLTCSTQSSSWFAVWAACNDLSGDISVLSIDRLSVPVYVLFHLGETFRQETRNGLKFLPNEVVRQLLIHGLQQRRELEEPQPSPHRCDELQGALAAKGFIRKLTEAQVSNVVSLLRFAAAADFSVPGSGKTTEALAYYAMKRTADDHLVVIAPINAFAPWEEQIERCFGERLLRVKRLVGTLADIEELLRLRPDVALVSYQKFAQPEALAAISRYISGNRAFVFLDESHKIKRGADGAWGNAALSIAHLPKGKLVMSGTPLPNSVTDLVAQLQFLHPELDVDEDNATRLIQPIFVRTTKRDLGLPEVQRRLIDVPLGPGQREIYGLLSSTLGSEIRAVLDGRQKLAIRRLGRSVLKLLKFVSNPALLVAEIDNIANEQLRGLLLDEDSKKVEYAVCRARQLAAENRKVIIWSSFVDNVEVIAGRLVDLGAEFIHGGTSVGSEESDTRERRISQFHRDPRRYVLVANPAAAGEAISLHTVCHNAIYVDRTYNAAQFLQSEDRIHRVGLPPNVNTEVEILIASGTVDESVNRRLIEKVRVMSEILNDPHLRVDAAYADIDENDDMHESDLQDFLDNLTA